MYETACGYLGMTPGPYAKGGKGEIISYRWGAERKRKLLEIEGARDVA